MPIAKGIHSGANTHHQLHVATTPISANFKVKKTRKTNPVIPIPFFTIVLLLIPLIFLNV